MISAAPGKPVLALTLARPCSDCDIALEKGSTTLGPRRLMREGDIDMSQGCVAVRGKHCWLGCVVLLAGCGRTGLDPRVEPNRDAAVVADLAQDRIPDVLVDLVKPDRWLLVDTAPDRTALGTPGGLVGYWAFEEGAGSTVADLSGNSNAGTIFGATWTSGARGEAVLCDGVGDWVSVADPHHSLALGTGDFTLCAWIRTTAPVRPGDEGRYDVVAKGDPYNSGISLAVTNARAASYVGATGRSGYSQSVPVVNDGQWHHLASRRTSGVVEVFVDGVSFHHYFAPDNVNVDSPLIIGRHGTKDLCYFQGAIDEVMLFARALSNDELVQAASR